MSALFSSMITRCPVAHDPGPAAHVRGRFVDLDPSVRDLMAGAAGGSPYLAAVMDREEVWLRDAVSGPPDQMMELAMGGLADVPLSGPLDALAILLRQAKRRVALITALADLGGVWSLEQVTGALTTLADRAVSIAVSHLVGDEIRRGKLPGQTEADLPEAAGMVVLAMGKMGAGELNYSSDIDLICLFDDDRYGTAAPEARTAFVRATRRMAALLSDRTDQGYVFRTDLRLRPDASVTPVCLSMTAAENYYESEGRTWERAAYIKARTCAGDMAAGARFLKSLVPFVWRKHLDYAAIQDAHDMRLRIRDHRGLHRMGALEGHNLKLGVGGIREIEFFTQTRQLIAGGRDPSLRGATTTGALAALAAQGWVPPDVAQELTGAYREHRLVEHRLQMVGDAQTHSLPATDDGIACIAHLCGVTDVAAWRNDLAERLARTDHLTEGFFAPGTPDETPALPQGLQGMVDGWQRYPALRSDRAQASFRRLRPGLLSSLTQASNPDEAHAAFDGFLSGLPAGVQIFALFEANPQLVDLIVDIAATAPGLARYLARNAGVLDAVIGGSFFSDWPGQAGLHAGLNDALARVGGYEGKLDAVRRWMKEWHFRIGVHHLRGLVDADGAGQQYADLARAVVAGVWTVVGAEFALRHGTVPGRGAVVLGMGSLGAGLLNAGSDLDLILIYDAGPNLDGTASSGPRPLPVSTYFARLTQALVTALSAPMAEGRLYTVDMRLRPSGRQGPVATSFPAFRTYQQTEAWTWEHLALTRAVVLAGDAGLGADVETFRQSLIREKSTGPQVAGDVDAMRVRLSEAKPGALGLDAKFGPGRMMDIELAAQMLALQTGSAAQGVAEQLQSGVAAGKLSQTDQTVLQSGVTLFWQVQAGMRLLVDEHTNGGALGNGGIAVLLRQTGAADRPALEAAMTLAARDCGHAIDGLVRGKGGVL